MKTTQYHEKSGNQMNRRTDAPLSHGAYNRVVPSGMASRRKGYRAPSSCAPASGPCLGKPTQQLPHCVPDLVLVPTVGQTRSQLLGQLEMVIQDLEQQDASVRTGMRLIKADHHHQCVIEFEGPLQYAVCRHRESFKAVHRGSPTPLLQYSWSLDGFS